MIGAKEGIHMNEAMKKDTIIEYAETVLAPAQIESIHLEKSISDEHGESNVWLLESDTMEEYWVMEGCYPSNIYKRSGIYYQWEHAYSAYISMEEETQEEEILDRFSFL